MIDMGSFLAGGIIASGLLVVVGIFVTLGMEELAVRRARAAVPAHRKQAM